MASGAIVTFLDFLKLAVPFAVAFLVSVQVSALVTSLQTSILSPVIGITLLDGHASFANLEYKYNENITIAYGDFINAVVATTITLAVAYFIVRAASRAGIDATAKIA